ncbi:hypothetical protein [Streptomyces albireticuli]|uniref:Uncharacterized protein n=1 Tax=Streptomyces albireticuli TaxID=1940 RepID=A0A2A2D564_9ACTN|nr:hypothetical protein [Streptomyces albireticuli]MCD9194233.1 hypothetical protein [Streptomyces albireticuli]PAU46587.1 hypothetical protein CK936_23335 [Streptomyces albireticuli]
MNTSQQAWTIDSISHALPHPELRATFMREATFTDVRDLPTILDRWVQLIEDFEAGRDRVEQLRETIRQNGQLPDTYLASLLNVTEDELRADAGLSQRGAA